MTAESTRFEFDPTTVVASIEVFPKGEYEFVVGKPKAFARTNQQGKDSFGVRYPLVIGSGQLEGKRTVFSTYYQSEGAQAMAKQFMMAALGYGKQRSEEERFDREQRGKDWSFDPATGDCGDAYTQLDGMRVIGSVDQQPNINKPDEMMQQFKSWRTITSGPVQG